ncbi:hypothetical protein Tco_0306034 [Tanacetum coccineum]
METRQALARSEAYRWALEARITVLETQARRHEAYHSYVVRPYLTKELLLEWLKQKQARLGMATTAMVQDQGQHKLFANALTQNS